MRYFGLSLFFGLVFGTLQAQESVQNLATKSAQDSSYSVGQGAMPKPYAEFLFASQNLSNLNVEILSQKELEETQGEFFGWLSKLFIPSICCLAKPTGRPIK